MFAVRRLDISWTLIHPKAPTQNTCAHCQRSLQPEIRALTPIPTRQHFVPVSRVSYISFRVRQHPNSSFSSPNPPPTTPQKAFHPRRPSPSPRLSVSASTGPRIIQPVRASSTPSNDLVPRHQQLRSHSVQPTPLTSTSRLGEGARILTSVFDSASPCASKIRRRSVEPAQSLAYRAEADIPYLLRKRATHLRRRRHRPVPRAHSPCATPLNC